MAYSRSDVHISKPLSDFALRYVQDQKSFIADRVLPPLMVSKETDKYFTFDRGNWRVGDDLRAPGTRPNRTNPATLSNDTYSIDEHALYDIVPYRVIDEADSPLQPEQDCIVDITEQLLVNKEADVASTVFATSSCDSFLSVPAASKWNYTTTTTPLLNIETGAAAVIRAIGKRPNKATIGYEVWSVLKNHADVLDRIKYTQKGVLTPDLVASCMDLDELLVGSAVYMSTAEGIASEATAFIWGKHMVLSYVNPRPAIKSMSHGYQFIKKSGNVTVKRWDVKEEDGVWVEAGLFYDDKIVSTKCAYGLFNVVA
jgi:hypothetical protein